MAHYCAGKDGLQHWARIVAAELPPLAGDRVLTVVPFAVLTEIVRSVMTRDPAEVPLVDYFRQVEAAGEFASPEACAEHIWAAVEGAANGAVVPVGALVVAERAAAAT
jgi:NAD(P)-dependent dehydrogenase (short-subunit alcohol dehydrogenase family)